MILASGFLALDAVLLVVAGVLLDRWALIAWGVVFGAGAFGVLWWWRRYLRHMAELREAEAALVMEMEGLRRSAGLPLPSGRLRGRG
jgi:hypothetical protein